MSDVPPLVQPSSPIKLSSCYLGTNFMFGDPNLKGEETKMQLSAFLANNVGKFEVIGLRFEFGLTTGKRTSGIVVFTRPLPSNQPRDIMAVVTDLEPSAYLQRVPNYDDYRCAVDFAQSTDGRNVWYDVRSHLVPCTGAKGAVLREASPVRLSALEFKPGHTDAVFLTDNKEQAVFVQLDARTSLHTRADQFARAIVPLRLSAAPIHSITYGVREGVLDQEVCFRAFSAIAAPKAPPYVRRSVRISD